MNQLKHESINMWWCQSNINISIYVNELYSMSFWPFYAHVSSYYLYSSLHKSQY
jgi:hypothetical protein